LTNQLLTIFIFLEMDLKWMVDLREEWHDKLLGRENTLLEFF
jgi:hypothetical protein